MTDPAVKQILDSIGDRIENIKTSNGYHTTPRKIKRAAMTPWNDFDLPAINYWPSGVSSSRDAYGDDRRTVDLVVEYHDKSRDTPFPDVCDNLAADIVTALHRSTDAPMVTDDPDIDLGGTVEAVFFDGYDYALGQGQAPWTGVMCRFRVTFISPAGDMDSVAAE